MKPRITILPILLSSLVLGLLQTAPLSAQPNAAYDIYIFNTNTGITQQVTSIPDVGEYNPSFSNNGKKIVHDGLVDIPFSHNLFVTDVGTGVSTLLVGADGGNDGSWSRNGRLIAFDRAPVADSALYVIPASGGTRTLVRSDAMDPDWSPNSQFLVFTDVTDNSVRTINLKSGTENTIAPVGYNPVWSRNGKHVAFTDQNSLFTVEVNVQGAAVGSPSQLTFDGAGVYNQQPSWSKNSKMLVFHSIRGGADFDLWTIPASGGTPTLLTGLAGAGDFDPAYSGGGRGGLVAYAAIGPPLPATVSGSSSKNAMKVTSYPNPFNPSTTLTVSLPADAHVTIKVYDLLGKEVATLVDGPRSSGTHAFTWNAENLPSGAYLYRVEAGSHRIARLISLLK